MKQSWWQDIISWIRQYAKKVSAIFWITAFIIIIIIFAYQIYKNWREINSYPWQWDFHFILLGFLCYSFNLFLSTGVWSSIIGHLSGIHKPLIHVSLWSMTNLAMRLPTPLPYIGARAEAYASYGVPRTTTLTAMSLEITSTIIGALGASMISLPFGLPGTLQRYNFLIWLLLIPLVIIVLRPDWLFQLLQAIYTRFNRPFYPARVTTLQMLTWVGVYTLAWLNGGVLYYFIARSIFNFPVNRLLTMINIFSVSGVVGWMGQIFLFIPNIGARQIAVAYLLSFFIPWPVAIAISILTRLSGLVFESGWALCFTVIYNIIKRKPSTK